LGGINIKDMADDLFQLTCHAGHLEITQWIYSFGIVNIKKYGRNIMLK